MQDYVIDWVLLINYRGTVAQTAALQYTWPVCPPGSEGPEFKSGP